MSLLYDDPWRELCQRIGPTWSAQLEDETPQDNSASTVKSEQDEVEENHRPKTARNKSDAEEEVCDFPSPRSESTPAYGDTSGDKTKSKSKSPILLISSYELNLDRYRRLSRKMKEQKQNEKRRLKQKRKKRKLQRKMAAGILTCDQCLGSSPGDCTCELTGIQQRRRRRLERKQKKLRRRTLLGKKSTRGSVCADYSISGSVEGECAASEEQKEKQEREIQKNEKEVVTAHSSYKDEAGPAHRNNIRPAVLQQHLQHQLDVSHLAHLFPPTILCTSKPSESSTEAKAKPKKPKQYMLLPRPSWRHHNLIPRIFNTTPSKQVQIIPDRPLPDWSRLPQETLDHIYSMALLKEKGRTPALLMALRACPRLYHAALPTYYRINSFSTSITSISPSPSSSNPLIPSWLRRLKLHIPPNATPDNILISQATHLEQVTLSCELDTDLLQTMTQYLHEAPLAHLSILRVEIHGYGSVEQERVRKRLRGLLDHFLGVRGVLYGACAGRNMAIWVWKSGYPGEPSGLCKERYGDADIEMERVEL